MARFIDLSDAAKGRVYRAAARKVDHAAALADIAARAAVVAASGADPRKIARRLESLRVEYRDAVRYEYFARTGTNSLHAGLKD